MSFKYCYLWTSFQLDSLLKSTKTPLTPTTFGQWQCNSIHLTPFTEIKYIDRRTLYICKENASWVKFGISCSCRNDSVSQSHPPTPGEEEKPFEHNFFGLFGCCSKQIFVIPDKHHIWPSSSSAALTPFFLPSSFSGSWVPNAAKMRKANQKRVGLRCLLAVPKKSNSNERFPKPSSIAKQIRVNEPRPQDTATRTAISSTCRKYIVCSANRIFITQFSDKYKFHSNKYKFII